MKHPVPLSLMLLAVATLTGCGRIEMFIRHHRTYYGSDQNKTKIAELESRVQALEIQMGGLQAGNKSTEQSLNAIARQLEEQRRLIEDRRQVERQPADAMAQ